MYTEVHRQRSSGSISPTRAHHQRDQVHFNSDQVFSPVKIIKEFSGVRRIHGDCSKDTFWHFRRISAVEVNPVVINGTDTTEFNGFAWNGAEVINGSGYGAYSGSHQRCSSTVLHSGKPQVQFIFSLFV